MSEEEGDKAHIAGKADNESTTARATHKKKKDKTKAHIKKNKKEKDQKAYSEASNGVKTKEKKKKKTKEQKKLAKEENGNARSAGEGDFGDCSARDHSATTSRGSSLDEGEHTASRGPSQERPRPAPLGYALLTAFNNTVCLSVVCMFCVHVYIYYIGGGMQCPSSI